MNLPKSKFQNIQGVAQNRITIAFKDKDLEKRFFSYYTDRNLVHGRVCHILAIFFYSIFGIFDLTLFPDAKNAMWFIRYAVVLPVFVAGFIYSFTESYKKYWQVLFAGYVLLTGGGYIYMTAIAPPAISHFLYTGIIFCLFFGYAFIRLRVIHATWSAWLITLGYIAVVTWEQDAPQAIVLNSIPYICGLNFLGMLIGYSIEMTARQNFLLINNLRMTEEALRESHCLLEKRVQDRTEELERANRAMVADRKEKRKLEEQFRQAQKMEAVGRLAGGVAHDFNNLMSIIIGYSDIALLDMAPDEPLRKNLEEIKKAGESATAVTRQLLAFSRKQILQVKIVNLNEIIAGIDKMLRRLIGEDVEVRAMLALKLRPIEADPGQMEQVLLNLVVNARDVMPQGGQLLIETQNITIDGKLHASQGFQIEPGPYVLLSVKDSGCGMDQQTKSQIFEPFFTTKEKGRGTGLGLATVYGIVKQSRGYIWVDSEPGQGTTFKLYFPVATTPVSVSPEIITPAVAENLKGTETLVLVEDDVSLRELVRKTLEQYGYRVMEAQSGAAAIETITKYDGLISLLVTDVVMPEMNGREVAMRAQTLRPDLKVLYMSGYTDDAIAHHGVLETGVNFIEKPFTAKALAAQIRKVLDSR